MRQLELKLGNNKMTVMLADRGIRIVTEQGDDVTDLGLDEAQTLVLSDWLRGAVLTQSSSE